MPKEFIVSDETLNRRGYKINTGGIDLANFLKNPICLYNHIQPDSWGNQHKILPIGKWENLRIENGVLIATPVFDDKDDFAKKVKSQVEQGILSAASIGIKILEWSDDPMHLLPGQTRPTITKCELREISIVTIPANANAVTLYDKDDKVLNLSAGGDKSELEVLNKILPLIQLNDDSGETSKTKNKNDSMNSLFVVLGLPEGATETQAYNVVMKMKADLDSTKETLSATQATASKAVKDLETLKAEMKKQKAISLVEQALSANKITVAQKPRYLKFAMLDYDTTAEELGEMKAYKSVKSRIDTKSDAGASLSDAELYDKHSKDDTLTALKADNPSEYNRLLSAKLSLINASGVVE